MRGILAIAAAIVAVSYSAYADDAKPPGGTTVSAPIVFFDIAGPDAAKLRSFYGSIFGWTISDQNAIKTPSLEGTFRQDPAEKILYMGVPDINAALKQITDAGGKVVLPRTVVPNVTIFALFTDPAGNRMGLVEIPKS